MGIKSREIYEAPAATILQTAHRELESITLAKPQLRMKRAIAAQYADLIYEGLWFSSHHQDIAAYVASTQRHVTGSVRMKLHHSTATVNGRRAARSLYDRNLATYDREDAFDHASAVGFIDIWGLQTRVQAREQLLNELPDPLRIARPQNED